MTTPSSRRDFLRSTIAASLTLGLGGSLLAACGDDDEPTASAGGASGTSDDRTTTTAALRQVSAMMPFPLYLAFIADCAASSGGFMADHGVDLDLQFARSAPQAIQQLAAGNVTLIRTSPIGLVKAVSQEGAPFVSIATANQQIIYVLVSTPDAPVEALADLGGRTVGLATLAGNAEDTLNLVLRAQGIDPTTVGREAVGNEAAAYSLVEEGRVDAIFATREATASMRAAGLDPYVNDLEDANPLLGTSIVTTRQRLEDDRDGLVGYLAGLHGAMRSIMDPDRIDALLTEVRADWELPQLDDPEAAKPVIAAISGMWVAAGEQHLLRNVPERWEAGVAGFEQLGIAAKGSVAEDFYTNDLLDEALS